jgi:L-seryl-tRNA(Ser) seleniumtransferase
VTGGGSLPGGYLETALISIAAEHPSALTDALRRGDPPVVARIDRDAVVLDLRTVAPDDDAVLENVVRSALFP